MLRCAASFVIAAYEKVRLIPHDLRALPVEFLVQPSNRDSFLTFHESIKIDVIFMLTGVMKKVI
jgi:hypothetical protein